MEKEIESLGNNFVIQKCIECSDEIVKLNPSSVNTFRVITYRWKKNIYHMPVIMRIGKGNSDVDNAHAGGMFIGVTDEGILQEKAFTEFKDEYTIHPETKVVFKNYRIDGFERVLKAAYKMAEEIPEIGVINWDFTLDKDKNPILIEANIGGGSIWLTQMANGVGCFGENTEEVLKWIKKMRKIKPSEYSKYMCEN